MIVEIIPRSFPHRGPVEFNHPCVNFVRKQCGLGVDLATHEQEVDGPLEVVETLEVVDWTLLEFEGTGQRREGNRVVEEVAKLPVVVATFKASACTSFDLLAGRAVWEGHRDVTVVEGESKDLAAQFGGETEEWG